MARSGAVGEGGGGLDGIVAGDGGSVDGGGGVGVRAFVVFSWNLPPPRDVVSRDASVVVRGANGFVQRGRSGTTITIRASLRGIERAGLL